MPAGGLYAASTELNAKRQQLVGRKLYFADRKSSDDAEVDKVNAGSGFDICFFSAGDELSNCEY